MYNVPGDFTCGTMLSGWLSGTHPKLDGQTKDVKFCFHIGLLILKKNCAEMTHGKITNCGDFFVYFLPTPERAAPLINY